MSSIKLFNDDAISAMKNIKTGTVDLVLADMPYQTTKCEWDKMIPMDEMWDEVLRITKLDGAILFFAASPFDKILGASNLDLLRYEWIWEKGAATGFYNAKKMPMKAHENILVFYRKLPTYNPQKTFGHKRKTAKRRSQKSECYGKNVVKTNYDSTARFPRSVLKYSCERGLHPTQKPVALCEYLIKTYSNEGETVIDFCMGSGTTGVAAKKSNRNFIGIENHKTHFDNADSRINQTRRTGVAS